MRISLSAFLNLVDGFDDIKVVDQHNGLKTIYEGKRTYCPFIEGDVFCVFTKSGKIVVEVA